jgi:hypothetical protein
LGHGRHHLAAGNITDVRRRAGETGAASAEGLQLARQLAGARRRLKRGVEKSPQSVRAASA